MFCEHVGCYKQGIPSMRSEVLMAGSSVLGHCVALQ